MKIQTLLKIIGKDIDRLNYLSEPQKRNLKNMIAGNVELFLEDQQETVKESESDKHYLKVEEDDYDEKKNYKCESCDSEYPFRSNKKFCSQKCRRKYNYMKIQD
jgi:hypothetical protein